MKILGTFLSVVGLVWGIMAFNYDTSVEVGGQSYGSGEYSFDIPKSRVNNIGLMNEKQNHIFGAGITLILGVILFIFGSRKEEQTREDQEKGNQSTIVETSIKEDAERFKIAFHAKNEKSWSNVKTKLLKFYEQYDIQNIISDKESSWMIGGKENVKGYVAATLNDNIIVVESFKLQKPDISILSSETKQQNSEIMSETKDDSTDKLIDLGRLYEKELISKEEFENAKKNILTS